MCRAIHLEMPAQKSRAYCFTLNNPTDEEKESIKGIQCRYKVVGFEKGAEGTPHLQGYLYFSNARRFNAIKRLIPRAHIEVSKGSPVQNRDYCTKDGDFYEAGEMPISQKAKGAKEEERWLNAKTLALEGKIEDIDADIFIRCYRNLKLIKKDFMKEVQDTNEVCGIWLYGPAGVGKSRRARELTGEKFYPKLCNKWWDGYQEEADVICDDIDKNHSCLGHHLKLWSDRYAFIAETKGGALKIRPNRFIVTSQYRIEDIWSDQETRDALKRRFVCIHIIGYNNDQCVFE